MGWNRLAFAEMAEWQTVHLVDACALIERGIAPAYTDSNGLMVINQRCVRDHRLDLSEAKFHNLTAREVADRKLLRDNDIVVNSTGVGTAGRVAQVRDLKHPATVDSHITIVRPDEAIVDPHFLGFAVRAQEDEIRDLAEGSTGQTELPRRRLAELTILLPPLPEQRGIAARLGALDDKIELNRRLVRTLTETAWAIFAARYLHASDHKRWSLDSLGNHIETTRGLSYTGRGLSNDGLPLHNLDSVYEGGGYKRDGIKWYLGDYKERHLVSPGDVVLANTEQGFDYLLIAYPAIVPSRFGELGLFSHHLYRLRPRPGSPLTSLFINFLLLRGHLHKEVAGYANGTTVNMLPRDALERPCFRVPHRGVIEEIDKMIMPLQQRAEVASNESEILTRLREALLPKFIRGEIRLTDVDSVVEVPT